MAGSKSSRPADDADHLPAALRRFLDSRLSTACVHPLLCVALSGGRDSVALLHALTVLRDSATTHFSLSALHVHHGLSPNADAWASHCAELCAAWEVPLSIVRVTVPRDSGEGLEGAARRLRHAAFAACDADAVLLAHHRDDQAETVLLNLLRGAGVAGAAGMPAERVPAAGPALWRPLLVVAQADITAYAQREGLRWIEDESNDNLHLRRNFLRREVMPALTDYFPGASVALARAAGHFAESDALLDELAAADLQNACAASGRLQVAALCALPAARARNLLRWVWKAAGLRSPDACWLEEALRQLSGARSASAICLSTPEAELRVYRGEIFVRRHPLARLSAERPWRGEAALSWSGGEVRFETALGAGIDPRHVQTGGWMLRARQGGERLQPAPGRPRRTLRNLLQESALPPWERERLPCLWLGSALVWVGGVGGIGGVGGLGVDAAFSCAPGQPGVLPVWVPSV